VGFGLNGKCALVSGAGGGLGGAMASELALEDAAVAVADLDLGAARQTAARIMESGGRALALQWDIGELSQIAGHLATI
jgi:3-oxoacyl-[acyl-carrier protein] reductase